MDELDVRIAAALQINGRATWQQVAQAVDSTESTVSRRAQRLFDEGHIRVAAIADPQRCGWGYPVLVQLRCEVGEPKRVSHVLAAREDVRFVALITGTFDVVVELIVPSRRYLADVLIEQLPQIGGIRESTTESVLRNFKMSYDWSRELIREDAVAQLSDGASVDADFGHTVALEETDRALYALLREDGRLSFKNLAEQIGISESRARRKVDAMVKKGAIRIATIVPSHLLGFDVECFCWIRVDLLHLEEAARMLAARPEVRYLSAASGYRDLICEVILPSEDDLYEFETRIVGGLPGIRQVDIGLELQTVKRAFMHFADGGYPVRPSEFERRRRAATAAC